MRGPRPPRRSARSSACRSSRGRTTVSCCSAAGCSRDGPTAVKVLVSNIGSTSLKWRLFEFSGSDERVLHRGGLERVTDYAAAVEECLAELRSAGAIAGDADLAAVGFKTV